MQFLVECVCHSRVCGSGLRCYVAFVSTRADREGVPIRSAFCKVLSSGACFPECVTFFPPNLRMLLAWTTILRSGGTLRNYLGYVNRLHYCRRQHGGKLQIHRPDPACVSRLCKQVFDEPAMRKAKASVDKGRGGCLRNGPSYGCSGAVSRAARCVSFCLCARCLFFLKEAIVSNFGILRRKTTVESVCDALPDVVRIPLADAIGSDSCLCTGRRAQPKIGGRFASVALVSTEE